MTERVPKRKTHRKSRNGCFQCKQRHTKCNEVHPRCANCVRLDIHCIWPVRPDGYSTSSYPTPPDTHTTATFEHQPQNPEVSGPTFDTELAIADLRLLHHWTSKTYKAMGPKLLTNYLVWQHDLVEIGFEHPFLLRGVLALAAIHKVVSEPDADRGPLLLQADSHISEALATYRKNLEQPSEAVAIPMFLLSSVLIIYSLASAQLETPDDPISAIHHGFRLLQGVKVVVQPHWVHIQSSPVFARMVEHVPEPGPNDEPVEQIVRLREFSESKDAVNREAYTTAIDELQRAFLKARIAEDQLTIALSWPASLSDDFTQLISIHDPIAVLILGYFAVLLAHGRSYWWIREWPQRIIFAAQKVLVLRPELAKWLEWPVEVINTMS